MRIALLWKEFSGNLFCSLNSRTTLFLGPFGNAILFSYQQPTFGPWSACFFIKKNVTTTCGSVGKLQPLSLDFVLPLNLFALQELLNGFCCLIVMSLNWVTLICHSASEYSLLSWVSPANKSGFSNCWYSCWYSSEYSLLS